MKLTNKQLKQIIKEELEKVMSEGLGGDVFDAGPERADDGAAQMNMDRAARDEAESVWLAWVAQNYPHYEGFAATDEMITRFKEEHPTHAKNYPLTSSQEEPLYYEEDPFV